MYLDNKFSSWFSKMFKNCCRISLAILEEQKANKHELQKATQRDIRNEILNFHPPNKTEQPN